MNENEYLERDWVLQPKSANCILTGEVGMVSVYIADQCILIQAWT